ncbi:MAG: type II secretion system inner membrane protein GspF [Gammaproteobacteria bacterium]|nr:MAG: type II secretion system inner membrane protein GspF [Gammaproteobacteria bacterium]
MAAFDYIALDAKGKERKGVVEGDTARQVRQMLRDKGLTTLEITESRKKAQAHDNKAKNVPGFLQRGISATELALLTRQLATLIQAALPLDETLSAVANQTDKPRIKSMLFAIRSRVLEGHSLATGLGDYPKVFPELYRATVDAGEQSGHLDTVLERLADYTESRQEIQGKVRQALIYPAFLSMFAIAIVVFMMTSIVPQVVSVFEDTGQELPGLTITLITMSDFVVDYGMFMLIVIIAAFVGFQILLTKPAFVMKYHMFLFRLPIIQRLVRGLNAALFTRTFSILTGSGVTVLEAMKISAKVVANLPMREAILQATDRVREGTGIKKALEHSKLFPPMTLQLIASGENSGKLEEMLERASVQLEREQVTLIAYIVGILEPVIILAMGLMVLMIVLGILLPIFDLNSLVK